MSRALFIERIRSALDVQERFGDLETFERAGGDEVYIGGTLDLGKLADALLAPPVDYASGKIDAAHRDPGSFNQGDH